VERLVAQCLELLELRLGAVLGRRQTSRSLVSRSA
jgi:hypothetical protein